MQPYPHTRKIIAFFLALTVISSCSACSKKAPAVYKSAEDSSSVETIPDTTEETNTDTDSTVTLTESTTSFTEAAAETQATAVSPVSPTSAANDSKKQTAAPKNTSSSPSSATAQASPYELYRNACAKIKALKSIDMEYNTYTNYNNDPLPMYSSTHKKQQILDASNPALYDDEATDSHSSVLSPSSSYKRYCYLDGKGYIFNDEGGTGQKINFDTFVNQSQLMLPLSSTCTSEILSDSDFSGATVKKYNDGSTTISCDLSLERAKSLYSTEKSRKINTSFYFEQLSFSKASYNITISKNGYLLERTELFSGTLSTGAEITVTVQTKFNNPGKTVSITFPYSF